MSGASPLRVYGWLAAGVLALGGSAILIRLAEAPPLAIAFYRMAGGALCLLPFAARPLGAQWRALAPPGRGLWLASAVFLALHFALWIESLRHTSVASSVALVTTNPVFAGLGAWFFLGERERPAFWAGAGCAFAGGLLLAWSDARSWEGSAWGNLLALGGAVMASAYLVCGRRLRGGRVPLLPYVTLCYGLSGLLLGGSAWLAGQPLAGYSLRTWLLLAAMTAGPTLIGHTAVNYALAHLPPGRVALAILGEPVAAAALAWWLLAEPLTSARAGAGALILAGIAWGSRPRGGRAGLH
ncbi:MAG: DMT family transporter [Nitrospinota bacterium]